MKKYFFLLIFLCLSPHLPQNTYSSLWEKVSIHEKNGLSQSALAVINRINKKAQRENNEVQVVKSLLYQSKYFLKLEEEAEQKIVKNFLAEIEKSDFPTANILQCILANMYWQYYRGNQYKFHQRTKVNAKQEDFRTWDLQTLLDEVHLYFQKSLQDRARLQKINLTDIKELLIEKEDSKKFRPSLFDFLSHYALDFYESREYNIVQPPNKFTLNDTTLFTPAKEFYQFKIASPESSSFQLQALNIYQELIRFHWQEKNEFALADVNIKRLKFIKENATFPNKDEKYFRCLQLESEDLRGSEAYALYDYEIAVFLNNRSRSYVPGKNETHRWDRKKALAICNEVIENFPKSKSAKRCKTLRQTILKKEIRLTSETYIPIRQHAKMLVSYKNLNSINFDLYAVTETQFERFSEIRSQEKKINFIKNLRSTKTWTQKLINEGDYQHHSCEVVIPKLDNGTYLVVIDSKDIFSYSHLRVTDFALVQKSIDNLTSYQLVNRGTGAPVHNATINILTPESKHFITDKNGEFVYNHRYNNSYRNNNFKIKVSNKGQTTYFRFYHYRPYFHPREKAQFKIFTFLDRSIYRPGQVVYFKAIAVKRKNKKTEVLAAQNLTAELRDVNNQLVSSLRLRSNEFGSASGNFTLPVSGLTGLYRIVVKNNTQQSSSYKTFSVEEYKRPKFEVKFLPVDKNFQVNRRVTVEGEAVGFAGNKISDAKVAYRVNRKVRFPIWCWWYYPQLRSVTQEIAFGETTTDNSGKYAIHFTALPDEKISPKNLPIFQYHITAKVTDINGETHSKTTIVNVGYHSLQATISMAKKINKTQNPTEKLAIETKNLNGELVPAKGTIKIFKLQPPSYVLRTRPWKSPDYKLLSKEEFKKLFPYEAYENENLAINWEKSKPVFSTNFNTQKAKEIEVKSLNNWKSGLYQIELHCQDKFGNPIKDIARFSLFSPQDKSPADNQLSDYQLNKESYDPGDVVKLKLGSCEKNVHVFVAIEKHRQIVKKYHIWLSNSSKTIQIPVTQADIGGFSVHYGFSRHNSFKQGVIAVKVPYPKTDLQIETLSFRDKLKPGAEETWQFKIKGPKGEKVSAELLAGMYDMSLDVFRPHSWRFHPNYLPIYRSSLRVNHRFSYNIHNFYTQYRKFKYRPYLAQEYDELNWFGFSFYQGPWRLYGISRDSELSEVPAAAYGTLRAKKSMSKAQYGVATNGIILADEQADGTAHAPTAVSAPKTEKDFELVRVRKNFKETAFFYPHLLTDAAGNVSFSFTMPEALTKWKTQLLAHTTALNSKVSSFETLTQKELMVIPNMPRFLRSGDKIILSSKIANLSDKPLNGSIVLELNDALTNKSISAEFRMQTPVKSFYVAPKGNSQISWELSVPSHVQAVQYKVIAKANSFSDGEQNILPVLSNRILVTETLPLWVSSYQTKNFVLDKLKTPTSSSISNHKLILEFTSNPAWYAVLSLPYLMEFPHECNEQLFARYYANSLAFHIVNSNENIEKVFSLWRNTNTLQSNLEKNEELKSLIIQETPWLRDAQSESQQRKNIALLFEKNKLNAELGKALRKLQHNQLSNGAWNWFKGGRANRHITQHIVAGFGHLRHLGAYPFDDDTEKSMLKKAIQYLDNEFVKEYKSLEKIKDIDLTQDHLSYSQLHYLYLRSFFENFPSSQQAEKIIPYYHSQIKKYWLKKSLYAKGLMALISHRNQDGVTAKKILKSLKENSIYSDELGMYWKENSPSWYYWQAPIETQSLLIEAFSAISNDLATVDKLKVWLLKNKQTNRWKSTKATSEAIYALLLQGSDWLSIKDMIEISIGDEKIFPAEDKTLVVEAGTGYFKTSWDKAEIKSEMGEVTLKNNDKGIAWGGLYWQYFEDIDKISAAKTPLQLTKRLYLKKHTDFGEKLYEITDNTKLQVGDIITVRVELRCDRRMEFIHMKDMRAAGLEPINVLSRYKWQDNLGYYESTKDASTNFFIAHLPRGVYVFEYDLKVNNAGNFSSGITTIQSMYAPEFSSHSNGLRFRVEE